jgi:YD repeat-containing protein
LVRAFLNKFSIYIGLKKMKINGLRQIVDFTDSIISRIKTLRLTARLTSLLLMTALLIPFLTFNLESKAKAQTNRTQQLAVPITAPPEPYIISPGKFSSPAYPSFETIREPIFNAYSSATSFISGSKTPEGLGAATPPATFSERLSGFLNSLFISSQATSAESASNGAASSLPVLPSCSGAAYDFDGDCLADVGRWQANSFQYKIYNSGSSNYTTLNLGTSGSKIAPADFDGDGKFDMAVFSAGAWTVRKSSTNANWNVTWGTTGDLPVAADYDGDSTADFAIYRPSTNTFWVLTSTSNYASYTSTALGTSGDVPVHGDYDGDDKNDCAVFRPSTGYWYFKPSSGGSIVSYAWGISTDIPAPGDFDSDGKTDITVFRPSTGTWYVLKSSGGNPNYTQTAWGNLGDQPVPADYDGDGTTDIAIYRPTTGSWWILKSGGGSPNYTVFNFGTSSDTAVPSAYLKQAGAELIPDQLAPVKLTPINATGRTSYYSRNYNWEAGLVSLPGRSGLHLNIGMSYNSLVWTKVGSTVAFDVDHSNLAPGFNFGFPRIEPAYVNSQTSALSYLMLAPSGARIEFRQSGASDTYETADASFAQIKVNNPGSANNPTPIEDITLTAIGTDGTQMSYSWIGNAYRCTSIKDKNGNYITISNNSSGQLTSVTDTLGRTVTFNYDSYGRVSSIAQNWLANNGSSSMTTTHTWASFTYTTQTISTSFASAGLSVYGPANNTSISVLQKVTYSDNSYTKFDYNSYGQVYKISNYAANNDLLNYEWKNINSPSSPQQDCPRFTQTKTFAANFNGGNEVTINNSFATGVSYTPPGGSPVTGTKIEVKTPDSSGSADALVTEIYSASSGWAEALPALIKDYAVENSTLNEKRWSSNNWTQENTGLGYIKNPRLTEIKVGDGSNTKLTKLYYLMQSGSGTITQYGLVNKIETYDEYQNNVLKTQTIDYNLSSNYISRRIIGLLSEIKLYEGTSASGALVSKVTFNYDENGYSGTGQSVAATQHDSASYGTSFLYRGNLTSTTRHAVSGTASPVTSSVKYNVTGSPISQTDARGRVNNFSYTDVWNDTASRSATYAYPTTLTDAGGFTSTVKYRYDIGATVWSRSPMPAGTGNNYGKTVSRTYSDTTGRLTKEQVDNTGAYMRYDYPENGVSLNIYSTIVDANNDNNIDSDDEVLTETLFDGAGRIRKSRIENPDSAGGYIGKLIEYNTLGSVKRETVPTEINSSWNPAGDDYRGMNGGEYVWLWKSLEYDWQGRTTKETNTDGTDRLISYDGCGCAGGEIVTIKGEITTATDNSGNQQTTKRRTQKIYSDILGRIKKAEIWDLDGGGGSPYSTVVYAYNGRDQITNITEYAGSSSSSVFQETTMTYDGHGRLSTLHRPEERDSNDTATYTTYTYHADDTTATITDPRNAVTAYYYGNVDDASSSEYRALLTKIAFTSPNSNIPDPSDITLSYDAAGNRTYMSDGSGNISYSYDELARLKAEVKNFSDTLSNAPTGGYQLHYDYHLTGGIKSVKFHLGSADTNPATVNYSTDKIGRTSSITGSGFYDNFVDRDVTSFVSSVNYRAFGSVKSMTYDTSESAQVSMDYNAKLLPSSYEVTSSTVRDGYIQKAKYIYNNDGTIKEVGNEVDARFSQYFDYDFAGRLKKNDFGTAQTEMPYKQTIGYDAFNNITSRATKTWNFTERNFVASYTNNRKTSGGYQSGIDIFDNAGNIVQNTINSTNNKRIWKVDASGKISDWEETLSYNGALRDEGATLTFDGDGRVAKRVNRLRIRVYGNEAWNYEPEYAIFSSVTGKKIATLNSNGQKYQTFVYMGGSLIAEHHQGNTNNSQVLFKHDDPITGSEMQTEASGEVSPNGFGKKDIGALDTIVPPEEPEEFPMPDYKQGGQISNPESGCQLNGGPISCNRILSLLGGLGVPLIGDSAGGGFYFLRWISESGRSHGKGITPGSDSGIYASQGNIGTPGDPDEIPATQTLGDGGDWILDFVSLFLNSQDTAIPTPAAHPKSRPAPKPPSSCDIKVRGGDGESLSPNNNLTYPTPGTSLGLVSQSDRWTINVEISGQANGAGTWVVKQSAVTRSSYKIKNRNGTIETGEDTRKTPNDDPMKVYQQFGPNNEFYFLDSPGIRKTNKFKILDYEFRSNFTSIVTNGKIKCAVEWHVTLKVKNGKLVSYSFGQGNIKL